MAKKVVLPVLASESPPGMRSARSKPSLAAARTRLGGTAQGHTVPSGLAPGVVVSFGAGLGVVVFASIIEVHVLLDASRMRRFSPAELAPHEGAHAFAELATDARIFGMLRDGQAIRYATGTGDLVDGIIVEKCRWGALVERADATVVAVGFRKLWPAPGADLA